MRKLFTILVAVLLTATLWAQSPEKMSYQAVIRNSSDALVSNHAVGMQISILQGTASGTAIYVETQSSTTNANGLVSIEIGAGTVLTGDFSAIDWTDGPYFIKSETDLTGGTTYTITGTSQLLSVPYALHAQTAQTVKTITETDPIFVVSVASSITASDTANWNNKLDNYTETDPIFAASVASSITASDSLNLSNLSGVNTGDQDLSALATKIALTDSTALLRSQMPVAADGSETKVTAGINTTVTGTGTTASPYVVNTTDTLKIGDRYQDGIVFWVDATGRHGLIAASRDYADAVFWYNTRFRITGAMGDGVYAGAMNTAIIVATQIADAPEGVFAAKVCSDYPVGLGVRYTYGDWYLPSAYELNLLYLQVRVAALGLDPRATYWSSTETLGSDGEKYAWSQEFDRGRQDKEAAKDKKYMVRAIRAF